ncbi:MAG: ParA family protein [Clostridia bacterium]|nr:ParA family protein [Oscillospiraceae bacterium]MBR4893259.1 ParA family protein [Clostridia bacterium]
MGKIISIANQKGGVGKTTTTVNLAACLGNLNKKVLIIDSDPQGNATSGYGIDKNACEFNLYNVLIEKTDIKKCIIKTDFKNVSICPCNMDLLGAELLIDKEVNKEYILKEALKPVKEEYDYILIDCPPSLNYITLNAFCATDSVLIPIQCEYYALEGVSDLTTNIRIIKNTVNPQIELEGILLTMFDTRTNLSIMVAEDVKNCFPDKVFKTAIPRNTRLGEAPSFGQPIIYYDKYCKGAESYTLLAKEIIKNNKR